MEVGQHRPFGQLGFRHLFVTIGPGHDLRTSIRTKLTAPTELPDLASEILKLFAVDVDHIDGVGGQIGATGMNCAEI